MKNSFEHQKLVSLLKVSKIGVCGVMCAPVISISSHNGGWNMMIIKQLAEISQHPISYVDSRISMPDVDVLCILSGPDFQGLDYMLPGGVKAEHQERVEMIKKFKGVVISIGQPFSLKHFSEVKLKKKYPKDDPYNLPLGYLSTNNKLTLGDTHAISAWNPGSELCRMHRKTLADFLKNPRSVELKRDSLFNYEEITFYLGNNDIRYHLCKNDSPQRATLNLVSDYLEFLISLTGIKINIVHLLPVEDDSATSPLRDRLSTRGLSYVGSREERQSLVDLFNSTLDEMSSVFNIIKWPDSIKDLEGKLSPNAIKPKSGVYLTPSNYLWDASMVPYYHITYQK